MVGNYVTVNNCMLTNTNGYNVSCQAVTPGNYVTVKNCTITGSVGTGLVGHGIYITGNYDKVLNCLIYGNSTTGLQANGESSGQTGCLIDGCIIYNNGVGGGGPADPAITLDQVQNCTIQNCLIYAYHGVAINLVADNTSPPYTTGNLVVNNTIYYKGGSQTGTYGAINIGEGDGHDPNTGNTFFNNIAYGIAFGSGSLLGVNANCLSGLKSDYNIIGTTTTSSFRKMVAPT